MNKTSLAPHQRIRSFVRRQGRTTPAQQRAINSLWPIYGFKPTPNSPLDFIDLFDNEEAIILEIGFGDGEALIEAAKASPNKNFIGAEIYPPGIGHCLLLIKEHALKNVRLCKLDAVDLLNDHMLDQSLSEIRLLFPDPWPKKKHHKRRIINPSFAQLVANKLEPKGLFNFATDWQPYAESALTVLQACEHLKNEASDFQFFPRPTRRDTKFERRGRRLGHDVWDLCFSSSLIKL